MPQVEASFIPTLVDWMMEVSNVDSVAAMHLLSGLLGRKVGPSTGINFVGMLELACEMRSQGKRESILSLLCDAGERYQGSCFDPGWVTEHIGN